LEDKKGDNVERRGTRCLGRRTHQPTKGNNQGYNGKHLGKASNKGKQGVQWETRGDKTVGKANTPSNKGRQEGVQWEAKGDQTLGKADTPSNKGNQEGAQWETIGDKTFDKAHAPSNKGKQDGETRPSERQTHHPTKGNKKGYNGQWETKGNKKEAVKWETSGDKTLGKAGTPFNTKAATLRRH